MRRCQQRRVQTCKVSGQSPRYARWHLCQPLHLAAARLLLQQLYRHP
jgi:hypothetical protein